MSPEIVPTSFLDKCNIWLLDTEPTLTCKVLLSLTRAHKANIHVLTSNHKSSMRFSRLVSSFRHLPESRDEWLSFLLNAMKGYSNNIFLPISSVDIEFAIKHQKEILEIAKITDLPDEQALHITNDKALQANLMEKHGVPTPKTILISKDSKEHIYDIPFPVVLKPASGHSGIGIYLCYNQQQLEEKICNLDINQEYLLQQYVEGFDVGCNVLCSKGEVLFYSIQKHLGEGFAHYYTNYGMEFIEDAEAIAITKLIIKALGWSGIAHIDLRLDKNTGKYFILEINGRYWASILASAVTGVNFPVLACYSAIGANFPAIKKVYSYHTPVKELILQYLPGRFTGGMKLRPQNSSLLDIARDPLPCIVLLYRYSLFSLKFLFVRRPIKH